MNLFDKYWLSAVIDCEGSITASKRHGTFQLKIVNTNYALLEHAQKIMGGKIYPHYDKPNVKHKPRYQLILARKEDIKRVLRDVFGLLIAKQERAGMVLRALS